MTQASTRLKKESSVRRFRATLASAGTTTSLPVGKRLSCPKLSSQQSSRAPRGGVPSAACEDSVGCARIHPSDAVQAFHRAYGTPHERSSGRRHSCSIWLLGRLQSSPFYASRSTRTTVGAMNFNLSGGFHPWFAVRVAAHELVHVLGFGYQQMEVKSVVRALTTGGLCGKVGDGDLHAHKEEGAGALKRQQP
ncbi:surface protease GP63 [Trypanosoma rangeli]|uniref:Leishmanolysin-like peptidase n=1 Tax=Trypanosoma rangeli TaxID=5698 RepID=A0A3R7JUP5_TRYRA|nr:surface protease GP63 [Trypanosoma rangeli]RNE97130.1 surface protease GP63 [Trypanosoma rangeli]|eukprot:RNE97130.1 surface protease GP63 [Trypanosoma rangeli]